MNDEITARRNNITHYSRGACRVVNGKLYVPQKVRPNVPWRLELATKDYWETTAKAAIDLEKTELGINSMHGPLINKLENYLSVKAIKILR